MLKWTNLKLESLPTTPSLQNINPFTWSPDLPMVLPQLPWSESQFSTIAKRAHFTGKTTGRFIF